MMGLIATLRGAFHVLSCSLSYCCAWWILSNIITTLLGKFCFFSGLLLVYPVIPLRVIGRLCSMIVALPGHLPYYYV